MAAVLNEQAEQEGFVHIYPDGSGLTSGWNGQGCCPGFQGDDVAHTRAIISAFEDAGCIDADNLFATGFSNGGFMDYKLYCEAADLFKGIAPMSGTLTEGVTAPTCNPSRAMTVVHFHGTRDTTIPYTGNIGWAGALESVKRVAQLQNCSTTSSVVYEGAGSGVGSTGDATCEEFSGCNGGHTATLCR